MSYPLRRPDPPATFSASDFANEVVLVVIGGYHPEVSTKDYGVKPAERVSIVMLTGRTAGTIYEDVMLFGPKQSSQFRDMAGGDVVLCRIIKSGKAIVFDPGSPYDEQQAGHWIGANAARLEQLRADTVRNFSDQAQKMREEDGGRSQGYLPEPQPQFQPQSMVDGNGGTPAGHPVQAQSAVTTTLQQPGQPASPQETGY